MPHTSIQSPFTLVVVHTGSGTFLTHWAGPHPHTALAALPASALTVALGTIASTVLFERAIAAMGAGATRDVGVIVADWGRLVPAPEPLSVVQHNILRAWLADRAGERTAVREHLAEAVRVAEMHAFVDVFLEAGPDTLRCLSMLSGPQAAFSRLVLARVENALHPEDRWTPPTPLTTRELEILSYLPTRFSNEDLARRFFVSVNTIKTHIAHIYRKLDVPDRNAAIRRAREAGIL